MSEREKRSPFGPYRPQRKVSESPFGPLPVRRTPRDPFAPPDTEPIAEKPRSRPRPPARPLDLLIEVAPGGAAMGHVPRLPGLSLRAGDVDQLVRIAPAKVVEYLRWLIDENLADLTPLAGALARLVRAGFGGEIQVSERERRDGAAVWLSGNPAVLFESDREPLTNDEVRDHLRFMRQVLRRMRVTIAGLSAAERAWKPSLDRRSIEETFVHIGDWVWWLCSRLDDNLPEPVSRTDEEPVERVGRLVEEAADFLLGVPLSVRAEIHVSTRLVMADPGERWTHTKACRRAAEHLWEHLQGLPRAVKMAAEA